MQIIVAGLVTNYELTGKGKVVVLLHGWGDTLQGLAVLQNDLRKTYQVLALDLPGFGGTQPPKTTWDLDNYSQFVAKTIAKLNLPQPYAVIGHSNGGALAIRAVSLGLLQPQKLILIAASGIRNKTSFRRLLLVFLTKVGNIATIWMPETQRQNLRRSLYQSIGSDLLVMPGLEETFKKTVRQDVQIDAANIAMPTLLLYAANDKDVPPTDGYRYQKLMQHAELRVIDNAGHFVHIDQQQIVIRAIKEFLRV